MKVQGKHLQNLLMDVVLLSPGFPGQKGIVGLDGHGILPETVVGFVLAPAHASYETGFRNTASGHEMF